MNTEELTIVRQTRDFSEITIDLNWVNIDLNNFKVIFKKGDKRTTYKLNLQKLIESRIVTVEESNG